MEIFVNNEKIDVTLDNEKTIGEVLNVFEAEFEANKATTTGIRINDKDINAEELDNVFAQEITDSTKIELFMITLVEVMSEFQQEFFICKSLSERIKDISIDFQSGKDKVANVLIAEVANFLNDFCQTAKLAAYFPDDFKDFITNGIKTENGNVTVGEFFQEFTPILSDFEQAIQDNDTVLLGDLAEYEISPRLVAIADSIQQG